MGRKSQDIQKFRVASVNLTEDIEITSPKPYSSSSSSSGTGSSTVVAESDLLSARDSIDRELEVQTVVNKLKKVVQVF
jgi:hypothetical protein